MGARLTGRRLGPVWQWQRHRWQSSQGPSRTVKDRSGHTARTTLAPLHASVCTRAGRWEAGLCGRLGALLGLEGGRAIHGVGARGRGLAGISGLENKDEWNEEVGWGRSGRDVVGPPICSGTNPLFGRRIQLLNCTAKNIAPKKKSSFYHRTLYVDYLQIFGTIHILL